MQIYVMNFEPQTRYNQLMSTKSKAHKKPKVKKSDLLLRIEKLETMVLKLISFSPDVFPRQVREEINTNLSIDLE